MRILGIDLGSSSVKAVEIDSAFGRFEIHEYHEQKVVPGATPAQAARALIESLPKAPDKIAVCLPTGQVTFRNLHLPTRDKKAIQAGVGFELEDELPFPLEQAVFDYSILGSPSRQSTHVHVAATLKRHFEESLSQWTSAGIDPDLVTSEAWAYRTLFNRLLPSTEQEKPLLLAQIGSKRTVFYLHWRGVPILTREIPWGGKALTEAIQKKYNMPEEQAETVKLDNGFILPDSQKGEATAEQVEFSEVFLEAMGRLIQEVRQLELTCRNMTQHRPQTVYIGGGTSLFPGLIKVLEEQSGMTVRSLQSLSGVTSSGVTYSEQTDGVFLLAVALALCLVGSERSAAINLRKGPFAKRGASREMNFAALKRPLIAAGAITGSMLVSMIVQSSAYKGELEELDTRLERGVKGFFGQISNSAVKTYLSNTSTLRESITKELTRQREVAKLLGPNPHSPLNFIKDISSTVPRDVVVDMTEIKVGAAPEQPFSTAADGSASLTFLVSNPQMAEKLSTLLERHMTGIERSKMEEVTVETTGEKRWKISFKGKVQYGD